ncbi:MAG: glycine zipper domain-containing protein [Kiritimatiellae bacterium]|jgi:outer membrane lipoprotein SlyB|nr:glycine zipper domain-containing protein [Kiritimatiellia bacterium]
MNKITRIVCIGAFLALMGGCATDSSVHTKERAVMGGLGGAVLGGVIGHQSGRGLEGAAVGAAAGSAAGAVSGSAKDEKEAQATRR